MCVTLLGKTTVMLLPTYFVCTCTVQYYTEYCHLCKCHAVCVNATQVAAALAEIVIGDEYHT